jgi:site-specific DNA-methyltransferase (adenine-specific)
MQTWDRTWSDAELYQKYSITDDEIAFIESMIRPMAANGD